MWRRREDDDSMLAKIKKREWWQIKEKKNYESLDQSENKSKIIKVTTTF